MTIAMPHLPNGTESEASRELVGNECAAAGPTVVIKTIGCKTNQEEILALAFELAGQGYTISEDLSTSTDIVIVNSCAVTAAAESTTRRYLASIAHKAPQARILVTGCLAQSDPQMLSRLSGVRWVVGNQLKETIPAILSHESSGVFHGPIDSDRVRVPQFPSQGIQQRQLLRIRYSLKIQEGCDNRCAYCVVPLVRGASRCAVRSEILQACRAAEACGFSEIVLTGTHIGQYRDGDHYTLVNLLGDILAATHHARVRLSSLDPRDVTDELLAFVGAGNRLCRHLHVSVQSLDAQVLNAMNRGAVPIEPFIQKLAAFCREHPQLNLGGDFIAGFPGETEAMFANTLCAIEAAGFSHGHVFRFSRRPGTPAWSMGAQVPEAVKSTRSILLRECLAERSLEFAQRQIGSYQSIIVERSNPVCGLTGNYLRVRVPDSTAVRGSLQKVIMTAPPDRAGWCTATAAT
jgi:threonylcarbamoyladenosine tRNA methylthiotransferase MtaB